MKIQLSMNELMPRSVLQYYCNSVFIFYILLFPILREPKHCNAIFFTCKSSSIFGTGVFHVICTINICTLKFTKMFLKTEKYIQNNYITSSYSDTVGRWIQCWAWKNGHILYITQKFEMESISRRGEKPELIKTNFGIYSRELYIF